MQAKQKENRNIKNTVQHKDINKAKNHEDIFPVNLKQEERTDVKLDDLKRQNSLEPKSNFEDIKRRDGAEESNKSIRYLPNQFGDANKQTHISVK